jgi:hypothetical protein
MKAKRDQHKIGIPEKRRGQQMGNASAPDQNRAEMKKTPAIRGRRKLSNKMAGDESQQHIAGDAVTPRTTSPSTPAMTTSSRKGETGGEKAFKARLQKKRAASGH